MGLRFVRFGHSMAVCEGGRTYVGGVVDFS